MPAPVPVSSSAAKSKDPKKVAAGRAGAAALKAKQERLLQELRAAKEAIAPTATPVADEAVTDTETTSRRVKQQAVPADPVVALQHVKTNWTPWILFGAGLAALCVWQAPRAVPMSQSLTPLVSVKPTERRQKQQHPEARSSGVSQPDGTSTTPRCAQQLKVPDPFHME